MRFFYIRDIFQCSIEISRPAIESGRSVRIVLNLKPMMISMFDCMQICNAKRDEYRRKRKREREIQQETKTGKYCTFQVVKNVGNFR